MKKNEVIIFSIIGVILELFAYFTLGKGEAKLTYYMIFCIIPLSLMMIYIIKNSYERVILFTYFSIPLTPLLGYGMLRLGLLSYQWAYYLILYIAIGALLFKNGLRKRFSFKDLKLKYKEKPIKIALLVILVISCIMAYNNAISMMILLLSFIPFILLNIIVRGSKFEDVISFNEKILIAIMIGVLITLLPDILFYGISLITGEKIRIFGPIGSNSSIAYLVLILPIALSKWGSVKGLKNKWTLIVIWFAASLCVQESRGALFTVIAIFIMFIIFDYRNFIKYGCVFLIVGGCLTYNVSIRADVVTDESLTELENIVSGKSDTGESSNSLEDLVYSFIDRQSNNRQLLWKSALQITEDYPVTGVGIGNFKYFFKEYSGSDRDYAEAHSILLAMSSEIGLPFMIICFGYIVYMMFNALYHYFKEKDWNIKRKYVSIGVILTAFLVFGNITGISLQVTHEIYSFTVTFVILFLLMYRDNLELY